MEGEEDVLLSGIKKDFGLGWKEVNQACKDLGIKSYLIGGKKHIELQDANRLIRELSLPDEMQIKTAWATHIKDANNPRFVYAVVDGYDGKHIVNIPRRYSGKLRKKKFKVEVIGDGDNVKFRHAYFLKYNK